MSNERAALYMIRGVISECTEEEQQAIEAAKQDITTTMEKHEEGAALMAMTVITMELAIKNEA